MRKLPCAPAFVLAIKYTTQFPTEMQEIFLRLVPNGCVLPGKPSAPFHSIRNCRPMPPRIWRNYLSMTRLRYIGSTLHVHPGWKGGTSRS
jgi:hypothetical protein